jgi:hypothetical protein
MRGLKSYLASLEFAPSQRGYKRRPRATARRIRALISLRHLICGADNTSFIGPQHELHAVVIDHQPRRTLTRSGNSAPVDQIIQRYCRGLARIFLMCNTSLIHKPLAVVSFGLPDLLSIRVRGRAMVADDRGKPDRKASGSGPQSGLARQLGTVMSTNTTPKKSNRKNAKKSPRPVYATSAISVVTQT